MPQRTPSKTKPVQPSAPAPASSKPAIVSPEQRSPSQTRTTRPPVVVVMGHIDHGKSTLLDYIRKTNVVDKEVGGITQRMSSYEVEHSGKKMVFIDTPGHESFGAIRARGASAADIAILVVSAEDGVKPQTLDAFRAITRAKLPYIVGISKIDKDNANIEVTKQSLAEKEIYVEGYGGSVPWVPFSGKTGQGVPELLDMILLVADVENFSADPKASAQGIVIESNRDKVRGISATIIIKGGTLGTGQFIVAGRASSPVRILENFLGKAITSAGPSTAVRVVGWSEEPQVGGEVVAFATRKEAEACASAHAEEKMGYASVAARKDEEQVSVVPILIKADTSGSVEAVKYEIGKISIDKVVVRIIGASIGDVSENDVKLASGKPGTIVIGFNAKVDPSAKSLAERHGVNIRTFDIIYKMTEWLEAEVRERVPKMEIEEEKGVAKILKSFSAAKDKQVMGGRVESGTISQNDEVKIFRREVEIGRGRVRELQQLKSKVGAVETGSEFGTMIESKTEIVPGDKIHAFQIVTK